jgi:hypothetical protein
VSLTTADENREAIFSRVSEHYIRQRGVKPICGSGVTPQI